MNSAFVQASLQLSRSQARVLSVARGSGDRVRESVLVRLRVGIRLGRLQILSG